MLLMKYGSPSDLQVRDSVIKVGGCKVKKEFITINVFAYIEAEDGGVEDLSLWWWHEQWSYEEELGIFPF